MNDTPAASGGTALIDLAREPDFELGAALIRPSLSEVVRQGEIIPLQPKIMQVLVVLARARGAVVTRQELVESCWGGLAIGDDSINRCIVRIRRLSEVEAAGCFAIQTVSRIGYRLTTPETSRTRAPAGAGLKLWLPLAAGLAAAFALTAAWLGMGRHGWPVAMAAHASPSMRSLAILPIQNLTGEPALDTTVDRLTQDFTYVTGRDSYLILAPRSAAFAWRGKPVDERVTGKMLGVRNVVTAAVRKTPQTTRRPTRSAAPSSTSATSASSPRRMGRRPKTGWPRRSSTWR